MTARTCRAVTFLRNVNSQTVQFTVLLHCLDDFETADPVYCVSGSRACFSRPERDTEKKGIIAVFIYWEQQTIRGGYCMDIRKSRVWILLLLAAVLLMLIYGMKSSCGENLKWNLRDGTLTITGSGRMNDYKGIFGDRGADGNRRVLCVDTPWEDQKIFRIVVEEGVASIGNYAFAFCPGLTEITLPETVTSIGDSVFDGCENLEAVYVEEGSYAEIYCIDNELPYVYLPV